MCVDTVPTKCPIPEVGGQESCTRCHEHAHACARIHLDDHWSRAAKGCVLACSERGITHVVRAVRVRAGERVGERLLRPLIAFTSAAALGLCSDGSVAALVSLSTRAAAFLAPPER